MFRAEAGKHTEESEGREKAETMGGQEGEKRGDWESLRQSRKRLRPQGVETPVSGMKGEAPC